MPRRAARTSAAVRALLDGVDAVVHLGGVSVEGPFEPILQANIVGTYNLYEAARIHGVRRIVFASSNHVTGFYRQDEVIDASAPMRPDGYYGLSKAFGENLAQFYFDRYGIETVSLRIGSSFPEPKDRRMLATWLSFDDLERLVVASLGAPVVGHTVDLRHVRQHARRGGTTRRPATSATARRTAPSRSAPRSRRASRCSTAATRPSLYQGGGFVTKGPYEVNPIRRRASAPCPSSAATSPAPPFRRRTHPLPQETS